ncbi:hypothetical protein Tco_0653933 [Tanacetum coccineum]|uniref:Uncharacterized protein n=1 Tax=Tanacetum coccineum TaxID=301880 RepID=A0ABQ4X1S6_9ASTR
MAENQWSSHIEARRKRYEYIPSTMDREEEKMQEVILYYNGLEILTRLILDSRGAIASKTVADTKTAEDAKKAIQEMAEYSQKWHNGTSRGRSTKTYDGLAAIQAQLNNLRREIKKNSKDKDADDEPRKGDKGLDQERTDSSTQDINTAGPSINTASININTGCEVPMNRSSSLMPSLEETGIFDGAYDDEDMRAEFDLNNLEITINVSPIPTTRIHKDHPKD